MQKDGVTFANYNKQQAEIAPMISSIAASVV
jgi:hypothetical protein